MKKATLKTNSEYKDLASFVQQIKIWGKELGFADVGVSNTDLSNYEAFFWDWLDQGYHGSMEYMQRHADKRTQPNLLETGTVSIISVRMNYYDTSTTNPINVLHQPEKAYIARYALGKDYHKLLRKRIQKLAEKISNEIDDFSFRAFTDSAPVLEGPIAEKAGLGFIGKNSLNIHPKAGSWFFLGELFCNLELPTDQPFEKQGCGPCTACIQECPTQAIISNGVVDARRCISYLTIEHSGIIPVEFRAAMGNRIYGCDDCQLVCPWNKFTQATEEDGFKSHRQLDNPELIELWQWDEAKFLKHFEGSPIRRIGYQQWLRNLAIGLGNMQASSQTLLKAQDLLSQRLQGSSELLQDHINWAIKQIDKTMNTNKPESKPSTDNFKPWTAKKYFVVKD